MKKLLLTTFLVPLLLSGCGMFGSNNYYQNDGPPVFFKGEDSKSAVPRVESFNKFANRPYTVMGVRYTPIAKDSPIRQVGYASWYGKQFHGKKTSIGEVYDMYLPTAAHPTMPLPSYAKITNLENGRSIIVRVNDRGPFLKERIIDLSYGAAKTLGYVNKGVAKVEVRRLTNAEIASGSWEQGLAQVEEIPQTQTQAVGSEPIYSQAGSGWGAQIGVFTSEVNAQQFYAHTQALLSSNLSNIPVRLLKDGGRYRVIVGEKLNHEQATSLAAKLKSILGTDAFAIQK